MDTERLNVSWSSLLNKRHELLTHCKQERRDTMKKPNKLLAAPWLVGFALAASGLDAAVKEEVVVFKGSESRYTADFEVKAPWILDWYVSGDGGGMLSVDITLEQAGTGVHQGSVLKTKWPGNGVRMFDEGGKFYFRVNSTTANWILKVVELTKAEAAEYKPREP